MQSQYFQHFQPKNLQSLVGPAQELMELNVKTIQSIFSTNPLHLMNTSKPEDILEKNVDLWIQSNHRTLDYMQKVIQIMEKHFFKVSDNLVRETKEALNHTQIATRKTVKAAVKTTAAVAKKTASQQKTAVKKLVSKSNAATKKLVSKSNTATKNLISKPKVASKNLASKPKVAPKNLASKPKVAAKKATTAKVTAAKSNPNVATVNRASSPSIPTKVNPVHAGAEKKPAFKSSSYSTTEMNDFNKQHDVKNMGVDAAKTSSQIISNPQHKKY